MTYTVYFVLTLRYNLGRKMYGLVWTAFLPLYGFPYKDKIVSQPFLKMGIPTTAHIFVYYDGALNMSLVGQSNGCICPDDCLLSGQLSSSRDEGRLETRKLVCLNQYHIQSFMTIKNSSEIICKFTCKPRGPLLLTKLTKDTVQMNDHIAWNCAWPNTRLFVDAFPSGL